MAMFGGSKTVVGTSVNRVLSEDQMPDSIRSSVIQAVMRGHSIADTIVGDLVNNPGLQVDRMYEYARDHYPLGLPDTSYVNSGVDASAAKDYIRTLYAGELVFEYLRLESLDYTHVGWQALYDDYGYDYETNVIQSLSDQIGHTVYLDNMVAHYFVPPVGEDVMAYHNHARLSGSPAPTSGYTPERRAQTVKAIAAQALSSDYVITDTGEDKVQVFYVYVDATDTIQKASFDVPVTAWDQDANFYHGFFRETLGTETVPHFFTYRHQSGGHPELDKMINPNFVESGSFFPFLFFRKHGQNLVAEDQHDTELFKASKRIAKYLNLNYQDFGEAIHENPDIGDVRHAALMMAVPANSDNPLEQRYLFDFFNRAHQQDRDNGDETIAEPDEYAPPGTRVNPVSKAVVIQDAGFKMALGFKEIRKRTRTGKLGKTGTYHRQQGSVEYKSVVMREDPSGGADFSEAVTRQVPYQRYCKQITAQLYEEITVEDLTLRYDVYKDYDVVADAHDSKLLVPLDRSITDTYNLLEKEKLYFRSMHMVYNAKVTKKLEWYETGIFQFIMIIIAVVITIWSGGATAGALSAAAAKGVATLAIAILKLIVIAVAVNYGFKLAVRELGVEAALILAVVVAAVSIRMSMTDTTTFVGLSADQMMLASTGFSNGAAKESQRLISEYSAENASFELEKEEKMKELEDAMKGLETDSLIDPFTFIGMSPHHVIGESPDNFYNRTIHSGNIGTLVYDHIHSYVDISLELPSFDKSVGDTFHG